MVSCPSAKQRRLPAAPVFKRGSGLSCPHVHVEPSHMQAFRLKFTDLLGTAHTVSSDFVTRHVCAGCSVSNHSVVYTGYIPKPLQWLGFFQNDSWCWYQVYDPLVHGNRRLIPVCVSVCLRWLSGHLARQSPRQGSMGKSKTRLGGRGGGWGGDPPSWGEVPGPPTHPRSHSLET